MDAALEQVYALATQAEEAGRRKVLEFIRNLQLTLETPRDTHLRYSGMVSKNEGLLISSATYS